MNNTIRIFIREALREADYKQVLGGIPKSVEEAEPIISATVEEDSVDEAYLLSVNASNAMLKSSANILDDVNAAVAVLDEIGALQTTGDKKERSSACAAMLKKDIKNMGENVNYNYPFRTALLAIAIANGIQYFRPGEWFGSNADELKSIQTALARLRDQSDASRVPKKESKSFKKRFSYLLMEEPITTGVIGHLAADALENTLEKAAGTAVKTAFKDLSHAEVSTARAVADNPKLWEDFFNIVRSKLVIQPDDKLGFVFWLKKNFGEPAIEWWNSVAPGVVSGIEGKIASAAANAKIANKGSTLITESDVKESIRQFILDYFKQKDVSKYGLSGLYNAMINDVTGLGKGSGNVLFDELRQIARAVSSPPPSYSDTVVHVGPTIGDIPINEANAAAQFFIDCVDATANIGRLLAVRTTWTLRAKRAIPLVKIIAGLGIAYEVTDLAFTDVKTAPQNITGQELLAILDSAKIRSAAVKAQTSIILVGSSPGRLRSADESLLFAFQSKDSYDVRPDYLQTIVDAYDSYVNMP